MRHEPTPRLFARVAAVASALSFVFPLGATALPPNAEEARVRRVLDGDSVVLTNGTQVRYLGINAPEAGEPFSEKARKFNRRLVEGKRVYLLPDGRRRDRYGRILAYVYDGNRFINAELVRAGLAHLMVFRTLREESTLAASQREARKAGRGMWGPGGPAGPLKITAPRSARSRRRPRPALRTITVCNISETEIDLQGFSLETKRSRFLFPKARLRPGHIALIIATKGRDRLTGTGPRRFHWPEGSRDSHRATKLALRKPSGEIIDRAP